MNDMTYTITNPTPITVDQSQMITQQLEQLWLMSALGVGLDQISRGEVVLADADFFDALQDRLFGKEQVIEA